MFDEQTPGEEDGVGGLQLLAQVHGVVARRTAVPLDVFVETVQINWQVSEEKITLVMYLFHVCVLLSLVVLDGGNGAKAVFLSLFISCIFTITNDVKGQADGE